MKIGRREVGPGAPVFVIAECGSNHGGSLDAALALIDAAAAAGADAAKFQRFRVDSFIVPRANPESLRRYELPDEWLPQLRARCEERGVEFLCTAFDVESLKVIDPFVNAHKVGSYENTRMDFLLAHRKVTEWWKPLIVSNGLLPAPLWADIEMECMSRYPADVGGYLRQCGPEYERGVPIWGVSDHTLDPVTVPAAAVALGACVVEKHFNDTHVWDKVGPSPDFTVSIHEDEFAAMVRAIRATESAVRG